MNKKRSRKKWYIIGAAVLVLAALVVVNLTRSSEKTTKVKTAKAKQGKLVSLVSATGKVKPRVEVKISANVSGEIVNMPVVEGQHVSKGDLLVQIDSRQYDARMRQTEAGYDAAEANARLQESSAKEAELTYNRSKALHDKKLASDQEFDAARTSYETSRASFEAAKAQLNQAKAEVDQAHEQLGYTTIRSPIDGYVTDLRSEIGEIVMGSLNYQASVIMVVSDLSIIEVEVEVDETDVANLALNQPVKIQLDALPDTSFAGRVTQIGNTAKVSATGTSEQVTNFLVTILMTDTVVNIKPGMTAACDITTNERANVVKIPIGAVVLRDEDMLKKAKDKQAGGQKQTDQGPSGSTTLAAMGSPTTGADSLTDTTSGEVKKKPLEGVFVVRDGRAVFAKVSTGISDQQNIEIISGLQAGDEIIVGPFKTLRELQDGDKIEAEKENKGEKAKVS